jgi:hypothetical protein
MGIVGASKVRGFDESRVGMGELLRQGFSEKGASRSGFVG